MYIVNSAHVSKGEESMNHIVLASHSKLAYGLAQTVQFFMPKVEMTVLEQTLNDEGFEEKAISVLNDNFDKNVVVFTDLFGGSVNQVFFRQLVNHRFHLVTGMNLALILECVMAVDDIDAKFLRNCVNEAKNQLSYMNDLFNNTDDE